MARGRCPVDLRGSDGNLPTRKNAGNRRGRRICVRQPRAQSSRLSAGDIGDRQMGGIMSRRLSRELDKLRPGDEVELRVYTGGQWKTMKIKTVPPDDLYAPSKVHRASEPTNAQRWGSTSP